VSRHQHEKMCEIGHPFSINHTKRIKTHRRNSTERYISSTRIRRGILDDVERKLRELEESNYPFYLELKYVWYVPKDTDNKAGSK